MDYKYRWLAKIDRNMRQKKNRISELNENESEALRYIVKHPACIANDLVVFLNVDKALVTRMVNKLFKLGYITISIGSDKRKKHLVGTEKAMTFKQTQHQFENAYYALLFQEISPEEQEAFFTTLNKVYLASKKLRQSENGKKI